MTKRRGNNEGSIFLDKGRNLWRGYVLQPDGKRRWLSGGSRQEVAKKVQAALSDVAAGLPVSDARITVAGYLKEWVEGVSPSLRPHTLRGYQGHIRRHIVPALGTMRLLDLSPRHVSKMLADIVKSGVSAQTASLVRATLRKALNDAVRQDVLARNVAALAVAPRVVRAPAAFLDTPQAEAFLVACQGHPLGAFYTVVLGLGLRRSEALGLTWGAVNLDRGTLTVSQQLQVSGRKAVIDEPKSRSSRRTVPMPGFVARALSAHKAAQDAERARAGETWSPDVPDLVFTGPTGRHLDPTLTTKSLHAILDEAGLPRVRLHDLRHTTASLLLERGVPARVVADLLGHSTITVTLNTYSHVTTRLAQAAADAMDTLQVGSAEDPPIKIAAQSAASEETERADNP